MPVSFPVALPFQSSAVAATGFVRPVDWLAMPSDASNKISILVAVFDSGSNFAALSATVTGGYTVAWGDGVTENIGSGVQANHQYAYSALTGTESTLGYRQAIIIITPQVGGNAFSAIDLGKKHTQVGLGGYSQPWLDMLVNVPSALSVAFRGGVEARLVRRIDIRGIGAVTSLASAFANCCSLGSISFPPGSLAAVTSLASAFAYCYSLGSISFPPGSLAAVTDLGYAWYSCTALGSISFPSGSLAAVTNLGYAFAYCYSLGSISFPSGSLAAVTSLEAAFANCYSLGSISFPPGSLAAVTSLSFTWYFCTALGSISFPSGSLSFVTVTSSMVDGSGNIRRVIAPIPVTFSVANAAMSATELDELYTSLPTVTAKTLTVTGNWGAATSNTAIATSKGWTVVT